MMTFSDGTATNLIVHTCHFSWDEHSKGYVLDLGTKKIQAACDPVIETVTSLLRTGNRDAAKQYEALLKTCADSMNAALRVESSVVLFGIGRTDYPVRPGTTNLR